MRKEDYIRGLLAQTVDSECKDTIAISMVNPFTRNTFITAKCNETATKFLSNMRTTNLWKDKIGQLLWTNINSFVFHWSNNIANNKMQIFL